MEGKKKTELSKKVISLGTAFAMAVGSFTLSTPVMAVNAESSVEVFNQQELSKKVDKLSEEEMAPNGAQQELAEAQGGVETQVKENSSESEDTSATGEELDDNNTGINLLKNADAQIGSSQRITTEAGLTFQIDGDEAILVDGKNAKGEVVIPEKIGSFRYVTKIEEGAFRGNQNITKVTIQKENGKNIGEFRTIGDYAFEGCTNLKSAEVYGNIERDAFRGCSNLESVECGGIVKERQSSGKFTARAAYIKFGAFMNCRKLKNVKARVLENISAAAFGNCEGLKSLEVSGNIGLRAFSNCTNLQEINCLGKAVVKENISTKDYEVEYIPAEFYGRAFANCGNLKRATLNAKSFRNHIFENCTELKEVNIKGATGKIGIPSGMFYGCENLNNVSLGAVDINEIGESAFYGCKALNLQKISLDSVEKIGKSAFENCTSLGEKISLSSVKSIGENAFNGCTSIESVKIPSDISTIDKSSFNGCTNIKYVLLDGTNIKQSGGYGDLFADNAIAREEPGALVYVTQQVYDSAAFKDARVPQTVVHTIPNLPEIKVQSSFEDGVVKLSWDKVDGAEWYKIIRTSGEEGPQIIAEGITETTYTDSDVTLTKAYGYSVQALARYNKDAAADDPFGDLVAEGPYSKEGSTHVSAWGTPVENNGVLNYVSADGTTSVEIKDNGQYFLKEESGGTSAWYAIDNDGQFKAGSRFWVQWLTQKDNPAEFAKYYEMLDDNIKSSVDSGKISIFLTGVTDPDGIAYTSLSKDTNFYVQLGEDWDKEDIKAVFISQWEDEVVNCEYIDSMSYPGGKAPFAKLTLKHFSPYAVFDKLTDEEKAALNSIRTGDKDDLWSIVGISIMLIISSAAILILNRKPRKYE